MTSIRGDLTGEALSGLAGSGGTEATGSGRVVPVFIGGTGRTVIVPPWAASSSLTKRRISRSRALPEISSQTESVRIDTIPAAIRTRVTRPDTRHRPAEPDFPDAWRRRRF